MESLLKMPIGSIIFGIVLTALSFLTKKESISATPCLLGIILIVAGVMRGVSDKINPHSFFGSRKEGLAVLLFGSSLLIINIFYLLRSFQYIPTLLLFGIISFSFSIALIFFPSTLNVNVPKVKHAENILDSPFEEAQQSDIFQDEHFYSKDSLPQYWDNASKSAKIAWILAPLVGGAVYRSLLHYMN